MGIPREKKANLLGADRLLAIAVDLAVCLHPRLCAQFEIVRVSVDQKRAASGFAGDFCEHSSVLLQSLLIFIVKNEIDERCPGNAAGIGRPGSSTFVHEKRLELFLDLREFYRSTKKLKGRERREGRSSCHLLTVIEFFAVENTNA